MAEITIKVGSVTNAQLGRKVLRQHAYYAEIEKSKKIEKGDGCGYSILTSADEQTALKLLNIAGVRIISVGKE